MRTYETVFVAGNPEHVNGIDVFLAFGAGQNRDFGIYTQSQNGATIVSTHSALTCTTPIQTLSSIQMTSTFNGQIDVIVPSGTFGTFRTFDPIASYTNSLDSFNV